MAAISMRRVATSVYTGYSSVGRSALPQSPSILWRGSGPDELVGTWARPSLQGERVVLVLPVQSHRVRVQPRDKEPVLPMAR